MQEVREGESCLGVRAERRTGMFKEAPRVMVVNLGRSPLGSERGGLMLQQMMSLPRIAICDRL